MGAEKRILLVAGEASGDRAAALAVRALREARPSWRVDAVGGPLLAEAGAEILLPYSALNVMGFAEVLGHLPALLGHMRALTARLRSGRYDLFLPVDFPGFNLRLAARARRAGVPVLYFIAPQVWAWGKRRVAALREHVDRLAVILPFEEDWFRSQSVAARFVGHPIMETPLPRAPEAPRPQLGLLPGSRAQEVRRHLPVMLDAARWLTTRRPGLRCQVLEAPGLPPEFYDALLAGAGKRIERRREAGPRFLADQGAALVASGTATLEAAAVGTPMAVLYRSSPASYWLARRLVRLPRIALANIVAGEEIVPEFLQGEARPEHLAGCLDELLSPGRQRSAQQAGFARVRSALGGPGCGRAVADLAVELLEAS